MAGFPGFLQQKRGQVLLDPRVSMIREGSGMAGFPGFLQQKRGQALLYPRVSTRREGSVWYGWIPRVSARGGKASVSSAPTAENILTLGAAEPCSRISSRGGGMRTLPQPPLGTCTLYRRFEFRLNQKKE